MRYPSILHDETGDYPSEEALEFVKNFDVKKFGCLALAEFIENIWWNPEFGFSITDGEKKKTLRLSTGGWSGNEEIICVMKENVIFWSICWVLTRRGGHYEFEIETT